MDTSQSGESVLLTRAMLVHLLNERLDGTQTDQSLARWAFDQFYAEELGDVIYEAGAEDAIADVLDELMFAEDDGFGLDVEAIRGLLARLDAR